jgi:hypothetical protein
MPNDMAVHDLPSDGLHDILTQIPGFSMGKPRTRYPPAEPVEPDTGIIAVSLRVGLVKFNDERVVSSKDPGPDARIEKSCPWRWI